MQNQPPTYSSHIGPVDDQGRVYDAFVPPESSNAGAHRFPLSTSLPTGTWVQFRVVSTQAEAEGEPLASADSALADLYALAASRHLNPLHSDAVMDEAERVAANPGIDDDDLVDLTHLPFFTIDEEHSKDLDQALCIERRTIERQESKGFKVWYAIADPAWCVRPGTALFDEAMRRGATYYLPGLVIPMLPKVLSEGVVSLNPQVDRRALVFEVDLRADGTVDSTKLHRARMRSRVKTSYDAVQAYLDGEIPLPGGELPDEDGSIAESIELLQEVGKVRMQLADVRDIISIRRQEIALSLTDAEGLRFVAMADPRNDVELYNEQISLLCNIEGARYLAKGDSQGDDVQPIYRVHDPPTRERLDRFQREVTALVKIHRLDTKVWIWRRRKQSLASYLKSLPDSGPKKYLAQAIHRQAMLTGGRSLYDTAPGYHFGVGADAYARFTAPMREMVGVFCHKETWEKLGKAEPNARSADEALRDAVLRLANEARQTQRELDREANRQVLDQLFGDDLAMSQGIDGRPERPGTILGLSRSKVHVTLDSPPIDIKVYLPDLRLQHSTRVVQGRDGMTVRRSKDGKRLHTVGDRVAIRVVRHDGRRDRWVLQMLSVHG